MKSSPFYRILPALAGIGLFASSAAAQHKFQHKTSDAPFLTPEEAVAKMSVPEGFEVSIFAAEPDLGEPIAFTFDSRGRVWVVENYNYVNRRSHKTEQLSRIQIFEDTDGDGVFDEKKLFHDKLTFASGIAVGFGGVYLGAPPNFVFIPDADGDDVPDGEAEILLDGWGIQDRHETLNSFLWGPDGWLYGCHGVFTQSLVGKPGTPREDRAFIDAGIWRFHPETKEFEVYAHGLSNPWGFDFNDVGHGFATCCVIPHLFHIVQGGVYHKQARPNVNPYVFDNIKTIRDHAHLSAHGGARFYLADTFPAKYRDQLFMCNIHEHAVLTDYMVPNGSSYIGKHGDDFLPTNDLAWVGFSLEVGPDGGVYILDWHDTDICGNAINFPDSGRIYRVMPEGVRKVHRPNIAIRTDLELVHLQEHANDWYVRQARTELHHRAVSGELEEKAVHLMLDSLFQRSTSSPKRLRALWAMHVTGRFKDGRRSDLVKLLSHEDEHVRAWAVQLLCENHQPGRAALGRFAEMAKNDSSPTVRLFLASALQRLAFEQRWEIVAELAKREEDVEDPNIPRVLWLALEELVVRHPEKALATAINGSIPFLQESVARRMVSGAPSTYKKPNRALIAKWNEAVQSVAPGFRAEWVGEGGVVALESFRNEKAIQTHPLDRKRACTLKRNLLIPKGKETRLRARVSYHAHGDWQFRILAAREVLFDQVVSFDKVKKEWLEVEVDLTKFAGNNIEVALENRANDWSNEFGYWGSVEIVSKDSFTSTPSRRPNVVIVMTDDQGYPELSVHGNPILRTPHLDRLHGQSLRLTDYHVAPMCTPTRGQLLTGMDAARNGAINVSSGRALLRPEVPTMANYFRDAGFATGVFGKWHLGANYPYRPQDRGFGESVWYPSSSIPSVPAYWGNDYFDDVYTKNGKDERFKGYCTDVFFAEAKKFMKNASEGGEPFLCYLATNTPHGPFIPKPEDRAVIAEKLTESQFDHLNDALKNRLADYLGMIRNIDTNMGGLMNFLEAEELAENTILIFQTDNGSLLGPQYFNAGMRGKKTELWEGGHRVPCFIRWPGGNLAKPGDVGGLTEVQDILPTLLDFCGIKKDGGPAFDGMSLAPVLRGKEKVPDDRVLIMNYSRMPGFANYPAPHGQTQMRADQAGVLWKRWRLLEDRELYNLETDPLQTTNVIDQHPEVVAKLREHLNKWWEEVEPVANGEQRIVIGTEHENPTKLSGTEWLDVFIDQQGQILRGQQKSGYWLLDVARAGEYDIELRRWPKEADGTINGVLPDGTGTALPINQASLFVSGHNHMSIGEKKSYQFEGLTKPVGKDDKGVVFTMNLKKGPTALHTWFRGKDTILSAYYVYVTRKGDPR